MEGQQEEKQHSQNILTEWHRERKAVESDSKYHLSAEDREAVQQYLFAKHSVNG